MNAFAGTGSLVRLVLRRDRIRMPVWVVAIVGLVVLSAVSVMDLYPTRQSLAEFAAIAEGNAAVIALNGRPVGLDTIGGRVAFEVIVFFSAATALMALLQAVRHTRAEEEDGRTELVRAGIVGRHAPPAAASLVASGAAVLVGVGVAAGLAAVGLPVAGSLVLGAAMATVGIAFAAVGVLAAQVAGHARSAGGLAGVVLGAAYALRAAGDVGSGALSWLSPIGWAQYAQPYAGDRWWPLLLGLAVAAALAVGAFRLVDHRDVGGSLLPARPGPANASPLLATPVGLAVRLHRASVAGWAIGVAFLGTVYGAVAQEIEAMIESTPDLAEFLATQAGGSLTESYFATVATMMGLLATGSVVQGLLRMRTEEALGRAELLLGTPVSRIRWAGAHVVVVGAGSVVVLAAAGAAAGGVHGVRAGDLTWLPRMVGATLAQLPAVWVLAGVAILLHGLSSRLSRGAWAALAVAVVVALFAEPLQLPEWVRDLSPFSHLPPVPAADPSVTASLVLVAVAAALGTAGLAALRRRDITTV